MAKTKSKETGTKTKQPKNANNKSNKDTVKDYAKQVFKTTANKNNNNIKKPKPVRTSLKKVRALGICRLFIRFKIFNC
jgi:hypothetical protein